MSRPVTTLAIAITILSTAVVPTRADEEIEPTNVHDGREYLVPELAEDPFHLGDGPRPYSRRVSFTPGVGTLASDRLYTLRAAYNPRSWLGWEAGFTHTSGDAVHALIHTLSAVVRYPLPWRAQPYGRAGYGMIMVYPGESLNSDPVTENAFTAGGGVELYVRDDVALRFEMNAVTVLGGERGTDETVAYSYHETVFALSFYRGLGT
jgi:opacity protein-like surface antigen